MAFCARCGWALGDAARFCAQCGAAVAVPASGGGPPGYPVPPAPTATRTKDTSLAQTLLLVGAALGVAIPLLLALAMLMLGAVFSVFPFWGAIPAAILAFIAVVFVIVTLAWAIVVLFARSLLAQGKREQGALLAVVAGGLMLLGGMPFLMLPALAGLLVVAGGILAWVD